MTAKWPEDADDPVDPVVLRETVVEHREVGVDEVQQAQVLPEDLLEERVG